ncbi:TPA: hypothetical protein ACG4ML_000662 [Stenotrophomonas maltophilia]
MHVLNEQVDGGIGRLEHAQPVLVLALDQLGIDDREIQSRRRFVQ